MYLDVDDRLLFIYRRFLRKPNVAEASEQFGELTMGKSNNIRLNRSDLCLIEFSIYLELAHVSLTVENKNKKQVYCHAKLFFFLS